MRHSMAHILAAAVQQLWPKAKFGVGPVIENGFYYDIDVDKALTLEDLHQIEKTMRHIVKQNLPFEQFEKSLDAAIKFCSAENQDYKVELLKDLKKYGSTSAKDLGDSEVGIGENVATVTTVSFYQTGEFVDLCRGPHVESTGKVGAFKLTRISGAYWRGDEKNPQLQRVYGLGFETPNELDEHLQMLEEAKKRDHRVLGPKLGIYMTSDLVGAGLPLLLPKGETIKHTLVEYMRDKEEALGYQYVITPVLAHEELYKRSGHASFYADDMYALNDEEGNKFYLKPMNCPHHHMIYEKLVQSYRDLPLKLAEAGGGLYRKELSGVLSGLIRVRGPITQNDSHIYVTPDQLKDEFLKVLALFKEVYDEVGIINYWFRLSLPDFDKAKYAGDRKQWDDAAKTIRQALKDSKSDFVEAEGEAAFYGPKLDVQIQSVTSKEDTIATVQVDILVPERMGLKYTDENGKEVTPLIIHRSILGSYERFMAFLIEQTAGAFPLWLAPEHVRIVTVNDSKAIIDHAAKLAAEFRLVGIRSDIDQSNESVGKKIRAAEMSKIPYTLVIGEQEVKSDQVKPRIRGSKDDTKELASAKFAATVADKIKSRSTDLGL